MVGKKIIINGQGAIFGRLCSFVAKKALEGNDVIVANADNVIITGNKKNIIERYKIITAKGGHSLKGPKYGRIPYMMLKRGIRGMLPDFRRGIGKQAFLRVKCYNNMPKEFEGEKIVKISAPPKSKFIELKELSEKL